MPTRPARSGRTTRSAAEFLPDDHRVEPLAAAAASCRGCDLYKRATQTVFGQGAKRAEVMLVGEQPGDQFLGLIHTARVDPARRSASGVSGPRFPTPIHTTREGPRRGTVRRGEGTAMRDGPP